MLSSMTGFGCRELELDIPGIDKPIHISVEIKTLNARFFELTAKLPACISSLEGRINTMLKTRLMRGRVFITIRLFGDLSAFEHLAFSSHIAESYIEVARKIKNDYGLAEDICISDVMSFPHVVTLDKTGLDSGGEDILLKAIDQVTDEVVAARKEEGKFLESDVLSRLDVAEGAIKKVSTRNDEMIKELKAKAGDLMSQKEELSAERQARLDEVNHQLDKIAVHEEISRFTSHLNAARTVIQSKDMQKGKKLDFILQELGREINTLAAKCSDYQIAALAVDIKVELEKVREQSQNIV